MFKGLLRVANIDLEKSRSVSVPRKTSQLNEEQSHVVIDQYSSFFPRVSVSAIKTLRRHLPTKHGSVLGGKDSIYLNRKS